MSADILTFPSRTAASACNRPLLAACTRRGRHTAAMRSTWRPWRACTANLNAKPSGVAKPSTSWRSLHPLRHGLRSRTAVHANAPQKMMASCQRQRTTRPVSPSTAPAHSVCSACAATCCSPRGRLTWTRHGSAWSCSKAASRMQLPMISLDTGPRRTR